MHKSILSLSLIGALALVTACQHSPVWRASEQRAQALAELDVDRPRAAEDRIERAGPQQENTQREAPLQAMTRIWVFPVAGVGSVRDADLDRQLGELLAELGLWQHIERIEIIGHTDSLGTDEYNQRLSVARADRVAEQLIVVGLDQTLIAHSGQGESQPVADNGTELGRAENRRIEIRITGLGPWSEEGELALLPAEVAD